MTTGKTIALTRRTFVGKVMSLHFNMLSRLVITFLPRSKRLSIHGCSHHLSDFGAQKNKVWHCFHCFPIYLHEVMGPDAMIFVFWMLSFRPTFFTLLFHFHQELFSSSLYAIRVVSSTYLRLLVILSLYMCFHGVINQHWEFPEKYLTPKWLLKVQKVVAQLSPTLCNPLDCSPPGPSVYGISQARILEWIAISFSRRIFPVQGSNLCLLHQQADSLPLSHLGESHPAETKSTKTDYY